MRDVICDLLGWVSPTLRDKSLPYYEVMWSGSPRDTRISLEVDRWQVSAKHIELMGGIPVEDIPMVLAGGHMQAPVGLACSVRYWSDVVRPYLMKRLELGTESWARSDTICEALGWPIGVAEDAHGPVIYRARSPLGPWFVTLQERMRFRLCPLDDIPMYIASRVDHFTVAGTCSLATYTPLYLEEVVLPYLRMRMELGI